MIKKDLTIREENNYYPFGLKHKGYNSTVNGTHHNWDFQGQERTEDLDLNVHEWKYRISDPAIGRFWQIDPLAENFVNNATYAFSENRVIDGWELEGKERVDMHSSDPNLQDLSPEERQAFNRAQNEALTFVIDQVLDEIPIVGEIKDIINGESIGTILLGIIPFGKKAKTVVEVVSDVKKSTKKALKEQASDIKKNLNDGKNSVTIKTPEGHTRYDLEGKAHGGVETPHKQSYKKNVDPKTGKTNVSRTSKKAESMNQQDVRTVRKTLEKRNQENQ